VSESFNYYMCEYRDHKQKADEYLAAARKVCPHEKGYADYRTDSCGTFYMFYCETCGFERAAKSGDPREPKR
jgi:hypothetical protein